MASDNMQDIKRRIKSVTSTEHITNAMKLVSAIIVAVAISMPAIQAHFAFEKRKHAARARRAAAVKEGK